MNDMFRYQNKLNEYINEIPNQMIIFQITKLCGYNTFVFLYKNETLNDIFSRVSHHFYGNGNATDIKELFFKENNGDKISITNTNTTIRNFIQTNIHSIKPIYNMTAPVVYKLYFDDGHTHC